MRRFAAPRVVQRAEIGNETRPAHGGQRPCVPLEVMLRERRRRIQKTRFRVAEGSLRTQWQYLKMDSGEAIRCPTSSRKRITPEHLPVLFINKHRERNSLLRAEGCVGL